ncbi:MAG: phospho-N-acetylmuramoyl-pentapeptide-transferase [Candidatus Marinamargulisbacteria bacterium]
MIWGLWLAVLIASFQLFIWMMNRRKVTQYIYEDSPERHQQKVGTPTLGGILMFLGFLTGMFILNQWTLTTIWVVASTGLFWLIGAVDDVLSLMRAKNKGLSARAKLLLQLAVALLSVIGFYFIQTISWWHIPLYVFLLTGSANATNLTDGLDGLLSSAMLVSLFGVLVLVQSQWRFEEASMIMVMMAVIAVFLIFNWNPARLFMGDVGSLMLGAFLSSCVIVTGHWIMLLGFGAVYVIETLSVIIQVVWFKQYKKRIFLMTPLHHHFELLGLKEIPIVLLFILMQAIFVWVQLT